MWCVSVTDKPKVVICHNYTVADDCLVPCLSIAEIMTISNAQGIVEAKLLLNSNVDLLMLKM